MQTYYDLVSCNCKQYLWDNNQTSRIQSTGNIDDINQYHNFSDTNETHEHIFFKTTRTIISLATKNKTRTFG